MNTSRKFLTHPFWEILGIVGAFILVAKVLHPRIKTMPKL